MSLVNNIPDLSRVAQLNTFSKEEKSILWKHFILEFTSGKVATIYLFVFIASSSIFSILFNSISNGILKFIISIPCLIIWVALSFYFSQKSILIFCLKDFILFIDSKKTIELKEIIRENKKDLEDQVL